MGESKENWITFQNDWNLHLKYYPQLKTKENIEGEEYSFMVGYHEEQDKQG